MPEHILDYHQANRRMIRAYFRRIPAVPDFTSIHKRVNKLDIKIDESIDDSENEIILAIDSTGIKVANMG
jgi:hypothetical protein